MSGISPKKIASKISKNKCAELVQNIRAILISAIEAGGSSLKDFTDIQGNSGYFQFEFYVYGRENEYCKTNKLRPQDKKNISVWKVFILLSVLPKIT